MRYFTENMATYCKPRAILIKENVHELLGVTTMIFQLGKQKNMFSHIPERDLFLIL